MFRDFVNGLVAQVDTYWEAMLEHIAGISGVIGGLCGIAALLYIGSKVWASYARGESIEVYPLLRPFVIGLLCTQFNTVVIGGIRGLADPICDYIIGLETKANQLDTTAEYIKAVEDAQRKAAQLQETVDEQQPDADKDGRLIRFLKQAGMKIKNALFLLFAWAFGFIADLLASLTKFVLVFTRAFSLSILCLLGPIIFAGSIFPGFKQGITQWIARFVCVYFWIPLFSLCDIFLNTVKSAIASNMIDNITRMIDSVNLSNPDPAAVQDIAIKLQGISANIAIIGAILSILTATLYKSVPTLASWIIAGGDSSGNLASVANFAASASAIAGAGAATVTGGAMKLASMGGRALGAATGSRIGKLGQKMNGSGPSAPTSMGVGPHATNTNRTPVGFRPPENTEQPSNPTESNAEIRFSENNQAAPASGLSSERNLPVSILSGMKKMTGRGLIKAARALRAPQLNHMMKHGNASQRYIAAQDEFASRGVLAKAANDDNAFVQMAAVNNEHVSNRTLRRTARYGYQGSADIAARKLTERGKKVPPSNGNHLPTQVTNAPIQVQYQNTTATPPSENGTAEPPESVGFRTQENQTPNTTHATSILSGMKKMAGRGLIKTARALRAPQLNHMMKHGNASQRYIAAQDEFASRSVLAKAANDDNVYVQMAAVNNEHVSNRTLRRTMRYGYQESANIAAQTLVKRGKKIKNYPANRLPGQQIY